MWLTSQMVRSSRQPQPGHSSGRRLRWGKMPSPVSLQTPSTLIPLPSHAFSTGSMLHFRVCLKVQVVPALSLYNDSFLQPCRGPPKGDVDRVLFLQLPPFSQLFNNLWLWAFP